MILFLVWQTTSSCSSAHSDVLPVILILSTTYPTLMQPPHPTSRSIIYFIWTRNPSWHSRGWTHPHIHPKRCLPPVPPLPPWTIFYRNLCLCSIIPRSISPLLESLLLYPILPPTQPTNTTNLLMWYYPPWCPPAILLPTNSHATAAAPIFVLFVVIAIAITLVVLIVFVVLVTLVGPVGGRGEISAYKFVFGIIMLNLYAIFW